MHASALLPDAKHHARIDGDHDDASVALMLVAAAADVLAAAEYTAPEDVADLPEDLRFAICDQLAMLYDARGTDTDRPLGLSMAASRIVARYRGVRADQPEATP